MSSTNSLTDFQRAINPAGSAEETEPWRSPSNAVKLLKGAATADPAVAPPYRAITVMDFDSLQAFRAAAKESGAIVIGDIVNFTDVKPVVQINENLD